MKYFAGIGARKTPENILSVMTECAQKLESLNYCLRSGCAEGADWAFQKGVNKVAEIWLPDKNFNTCYQIQKPDHEYRIISEDDKEAFDSLKFHPNPAALFGKVRKLMARNFRQIIGDGAPNSSFVICWTADGKASKGTGQALRIAAHYNIPVFNLAKQNDLDRILKFIS